MPFDHLPAAYNQWAKNSGHPKRTALAISSALIRYGISRKAEGEWIRVGYVAEVLGISIDVPQRWAEQKLLPYYINPKKKGQRYFTRSNLVDLARRQPDLFGGIDRDRLFLLLEDSDLVDSILSAFPNRKGSGKLIMAVESGQVFPSLCAAARAIGVCPQSIYFAMKRGRRCAGFHWKHV